MPPLDYQWMIHEALRDVVRQALAQVAEEGLPGDHHFVIELDTRCPGVEMPPSLRAAYPERMPIILQHQFWQLDAGDRQFSVTLAFGGMRQRLTVPYTAVVSFVDPGAEFGLRFDLERRDGRSDEERSAEAASQDRAGGEEADGDGGERRAPVPERPRAVRNGAAEGADGDDARHNGDGGRVVQFHRVRPKKDEAGEP